MPVEAGEMPISGDWQAGLGDSASRSEARPGSETRGIHPRISFFDKLVFILYCLGDRKSVV